MLREFKTFALRGDLLDIAVAFILGVAFASVVNALVDGVLMPLIAAIVGKPNFDALTFNVGSGVIRYGAFLTTLVNFFLIAFVLFLILKAANRAIRRPPETPVRECPYCRTPIPITASRCSACTSDVESRIA